VHITIGKIIKPIEISYETICAADLKDPKNAYLELLAQPAKIMLYTPKEDIANIYNTFKSLFMKTLCGLNGITAQLIKANIKVDIGATTNIKLFALLGIIISFNTNFKPSANACNNPHTPTTLGPRLRCIEPIIFLSATVKKATAINKGTIIDTAYSIQNNINK
jgi:hypothetical protein